MPYIAPKDARNKFVDSLSDINTRNDSPPWRECVAATKRFRMVLLCWPPSYHYPKHYHPRADESWVICEGQVRAIFNDGAATIAGPGSILFARKGVIHDMTTVGNEPLLMIATVTPNELDDEIRVP
jgi:mannose-6-phosphate isomerase-like protein (cupin superfamily)